LVEFANKDKAKTLYIMSIRAFVRTSANVGRILLQTLKKVDFLFFSVWNADDTDEADFR